MKTEYTTYEIYARLLRLFRWDYPGQYEEIENFCMSHDYDRVLDALDLINRESKPLGNEYNWSNICAKNMKDLIFSKDA